MKFFVLIFLIELTIIVNCRFNEKNVKKEWNLFMTKHNKEYKTNIEEEFRYKIFIDNLREINEHNKKYEEGLETYYLGVNKFTDKLFVEYLEEISCGTKRLINDDDNIDDYYDNSDDYDDADNNTINTSEWSKFKVPDEIDWVKKGAVTRVKDQTLPKSCGCCYAFGAIAALESANWKKNGKLISLSEQNIVDCSKKNGNLGCQGGWSYKAFNYIKKNGGVNTEASYPYRGTCGKCRYDPKNIGAKLTSFKKIRAGNENSIKNIVGEHGPVVVDIDAGRYKFKHYEGGIYNDPKCSQNTNHVVTIVGYGTKNGQDYWKVKNSWGTDWGDNGYAYMSRNNKNQCGIASDVYYPTAT